MLKNMKLHDDEKILIDAQPIKKVVPYWVITNGFHVVSIVVFLTFFFWIKSKTDSDFSGVTSFFSHLNGSEYLIPLLVFAGVIGLLYLWFSSRVGAHHYRVTNQRCIFGYGVWTNNKAIVPFNRIADVYTYQNILEKIFGITSLYITDIGTPMATGSFGRRTTAGNGGMLRMQGLNEEQAEEILDIISQHISSK
jgi:membrane protein YdbS with pleckstrin-like domain